MPYTHTGLDLVHILSSGSARTICIPLKVSGIDLDLDRIIDQRIHEDRRECRLAFSLSIERRNTYKTMHSAFCLEITESIVAFHLHSHRLDAGILTFKFVGNRNLIAVTLSPTHIHTHEHRRPVVGLRSASSGIDREHSSEIISLLAKHIAKLESLKLLNHSSIGLIYFLILKLQKDIQVLYSGSYLIIAGHPELDS